MDFEVILSVVIKVSRMQQRFGGNAAHVQTGSSEAAPMLYTRGLEVVIVSFHHDTSSKEIGLKLTLSPS